MKVGLIDADSVLPNLALMKLSQWHKNQGDNISLLRYNIPYYPCRNKPSIYVSENFDKVYCSVIYNKNMRYVENSIFIRKETITFGGSGYSLKVVLPKEVEECEPDYTIYPEGNTSYGFISRGCIRKCSFCIVPEKEGYIHQVSTIKDIVRHSRVEFLDNNFLALKNHKELLQELVDSHIKCRFSQGLDIRLLDNENSKLLSELNYMGNYTFAFDDYSYLPSIEKKVDLLSWRTPYQVRLFIYCHPDMILSNICKRVNWCKANKMLPYIMRHIDCWGSRYEEFYTDLAAFCNQPEFFKKLTFNQFLNKRHKDLKRVVEHSKLYEEHILCPD